MAHRTFTAITDSRDAAIRRVHCDGCDPRRLPDEVVGANQLWVVTAGTFAVAGKRGRTLLDPSTALVLAKDDPYVVRHPGGPDVCLSISGAVVDELARDGTRALHLDATQYADLVGAVARGDDDLSFAESLAALDPAHQSVRRDGELVEALKDEIRRTYADDRTLSTLVATVGGSVHHACHAFRAATGLTMNAYRNEIRLRHALASVLDGSTKLGAIADATGFASHSHFTNRFTARFGKAPAVVRAARAL